MNERKFTYLKIPFYFFSFSSLIFLLISIVCFNGVNDVTNIVINCVIVVLAAFFIISFFRLFFESDGSFVSVIFLIFIPLLALLHYALILYSNNYPNLGLWCKATLLVCYSFLFLAIPLVALLISSLRRKAKQEVELKDIESILKERSDLFDVLNKYLSKTFSYSGALFINGAWGSGKTFYLNNFLSYFLMKNKKSKVISVSLNGLESISELQERMFWNNHPKSHAFFETRIGKTTETILRKIGFSFKEVKQDKLNVQLVVFDDLERSSINTIKLFGLIDSILSTKTKVILIGNEIEIKDPFNPGEYDNNRLIAAITLNKNKSKDISKADVDHAMEKIGSSQYYDRIKEKIICMSYRFNFSFSVFIDHIVGKYDSIKNITMRNISKINSIIKKFRCSNLRVCEIALIYFDEINKIIDEIIAEKSNIMKDDEFKTLLKNNVLLYVVYCVIKEKIPNIYETNDKEKSDYFPYSFGIGMVFKTIETNVKTLRIDKEDFSIDIESEFAEYQEAKNDKLPNSMIKLGEYHWGYLNDRDVIKYINIMLDDLYKKRIPIHKIYLAYHYFYIFNVHYGFKSKYTSNDILNEILQQIDDAAPEKLIKFKEKVFDENFFLGQYPEGERHDLKQIFDKMISVCMKGQVKNMNDNFSNLEEFISNIDKYSAQAIEYRSFLSSIDKQKIDDIIKNGTNAELNNLREALRNVYESSNIREFFKSDTEAITNLSKAVSSYSEALKNIPNINIKKKNLEYLIDDLENIKKRLQ